MVWALGLRVWGLGFGMVGGLGLGVQGLGFRVWVLVFSGLGFSCLPKPPKPD